jgi:hypothetical protein
MHRELAARTESNLQLCLVNEYPINLFHVTNKINVLLEDGFIFVNQNDGTNSRKEVDGVIHVTSLFDSRFEKELGGLSGILYKASLSTSASAVPST